MLALTPHPDAIDTTPQPIPYGWFICEYTLLIEERFCESCGVVHTAPAHSLRVKIVHRKTEATKTISLPDLNIFYSALPKTVRAEFNRPTLPRKIKRIKTSVSFCQHCFVETSTKQADLLKPDYQLLSPQDVARYNEGREHLAEELGRVPTSAEIKKYKPAKKAQGPVAKAATFNLKDFLP